MLLRSEGRHQMGACSAAKKLLNHVLADSWSCLVELEAFGLSFEWDGGGERSGSSFRIPQLGSPP